MTMAIAESRGLTIEGRIIKYLRKTGNAHTAKELGHLLNLSKGTVRRRFTDLKKKGLVRVVGQVSERGPLGGRRRVDVCRAV